MYGVNTGLGAAVDTQVSPRDAAVQGRVPLARSVGVGRGASEHEVRAIIVARIARLAKGFSGASGEVVTSLVELLNRRVHPVVPMTGSIGEADLAPLAHIASVLIGAGEAEFRGSVVTGAEALAQAGLSPLALRSKDGLALVSSNAASVGVGALVLSDAKRTLEALLAAAALSFEGYRANLTPLSPEATRLRPVPGQGAVAGVLLKAFEGGQLTEASASRRLQDPLSFRCIGPVYGACSAALAATADAVDLELNSADDNPAIVSDPNRSVPTANFDATHLALAFEGLGLAMARVAALCGERIMKLMSPSSSDLPRFLSPLQEGRTGFATVQKTISALMAEIQFRTAPMPVVVMPVADRVEDYATMALSSVEKAGEIVERMGFLAAIELMVAAQACDLRQGLVLGHGTQSIYETVRASVAPLGEDRPSAPDIKALADLIRAGAFDTVSPVHGGL
jgi:histidine ammonia-lyase